MNKWSLLLLNLLFVLLPLTAQTISVKDKFTQEGVSFATISFGDGKGTIADDEGSFTFSKKLYKDIDSLFISAVGYDELAIPTQQLPTTLLLTPATNELETVMVTVPLKGRFKKERIKGIHHDNYFNCWLPTVESEIAVKWERINNQPTQIQSVSIPIVKEDSQVSKKGKLRAFSTMVRIQFYDAVNGKPTYRSFYPHKIHIITQKSDDIVEIDIEDLHINIPEGGLYVSIQVLGYTTPDGKLIKAKKYREIDTIHGIQKISTTYRPLLPFHNEEVHRVTWVRRIFYKDKQWVPFDLKYNPNSALVRSGHVNYGMGARLKVYQVD